MRGNSSKKSIFCNSAVFPGPGTGGGHCEIVGKGMMGGDSGKRVKKQNREVERR